MAKILRPALLSLLLVAAAQAQTGTTFVQDVRKLTGDVGVSTTPFTWPDTMVLAEVNMGIAEVGVLGLAVTVWDTLSLAADTLNYGLSRSPIEVLTAYRLEQTGGMFGVSPVNVSDFWTASDQVAYTLIDDQVFVTQTLSEQYKFVVVYTAAPIPLDTITDTTDIPEAVQPAVSYLAAANLMLATRTQTNAAIGQAYRQLGQQLVMRWLQARRGKPTDSLAVPR